MILIAIKAINSTQYKKNREKMSTFDTHEKDPLYLISRYSICMVNKDKNTAIAIMYPV